MIALEVSLNGERLCVAGADDLSVLNATLSIGGKLGTRTVMRKLNAGGDQIQAEPDPTLHIGGLASRGDNGRDEHLRWCRNASISVGDVVELRFANVESAGVDSPDPETIPREKYERQVFEIAKAKYFALKDIYEKSEL